VSGKVAEAEELAQLRHDLGRDDGGPEPLDGYGSRAQEIRVPVRARGDVAIERAQDAREHALDGRVKSSASWTQSSSPYGETRRARRWV
jgi:hypothetical protein